MKKIILLLFFVANMSVMMAQSDNFGIEIGRPSVLISPYYTDWGKGVADLSLYYSHSFKNTVAFGIKMQSDLFYNVDLLSSYYPPDRNYYNNYALMLFAEKSFLYRNMLIKPSLLAGPCFTFVHSRDYDTRINHSYLRNSYGFNIFQIAPELKIGFINGEKANLGFFLMPKLNIYSSEVRLGTSCSGMMTFGLFAELNKISSRN